MKRDAYCKPIFYEFPGFKPINVNTIVRYGYKKGKRKRYWDDQRIRTYAWENFWRKLFGRKLLMPKAGGYFCAPHISITFTNSHYPDDYGFSSNTTMERELKKFESFLESL